MFCLLDVMLVCMGLCKCVVKGGWHSNTLSSLPDIDRKISGMLLDLADRIPYNSVRESTAAVWDNFRVMTQSCRSAAELAQQVRLSESSLR